MNVELELKEVGPVIATRQLDLRGKPTVKVIVGKPRPYPEPPEDYYCPFQIVGLGNEKIYYASGVDSVQALALALRKIGILLNASKAYKRGELTMYNDRELIFPLSEDARD
jgi:hypothetical protein